MKCKHCGEEMYLAFTDEWVCKCGRKYNIKGHFISKDIVRKATLV